VIPVPSLRIDTGKSPSGEEKSPAMKELAAAERRAIPQCQEALGSTGVGLRQHYLSHVGPGLSNLVYAMAV
jgi:hypothetical protein